MADDFNQQIDVIAQQIDDDINKAVRKVALAVHKQVVTATPIDVGTARSNWQMTLDAPVSGTIPAYVPGKSGSTAGANVAATLAQGMAAVAGRQSGQDVFIANNLPYIGVLNEGEHSTQAAENFVETAVMAGIKEAQRVKVLD